MGIDQRQPEYDAWVTLLSAVLNAGNLITAANPLQVSVAAIVPAAVDVTDRAARLLGIAGRNWNLGAADVPDLTDRWARQLGLVDVSRYLGAAVGPANPVDVRDTGINTNPRRYEKDNGFRSPVVARAGGVATALWTGATVPARTAGQSTTIYTLTIENSTGAAITAWLEIAGVAITIPYHVADNNSIVIDFVGGLTSGDFDVNCNASVNGVNFSIYGTEA